MIAQSHHLRAVGLLVAIIIPWTFDSGTAHQGEEHQDALLTLEGEVMVGIAQSSPPGDTLTVFGDTSLFQQRPGDEWVRTGDAPGRDVVTVDAGKTGVMLAGETPPCLRGGEMATLRSSTDGGQTWTEVPGTEGFTPLAISEREKIALSTSCTGLHSSTDAGETWNTVDELKTEGDEITSAFVVFPTGEDAWNVTVLLGLTTEGGSSSLASVMFGEAGITVEQGIQDYWAVAPIAAADDTWLIGASNGVFVSTNAGSDWEMSRAGLDEVSLDQDPLVDGLPAGVEPNSFGFHSVGITPNRETAVLGSVDGVYVSSGSLRNWERIAADDVTGPVDAVMITMDGATLLAATETGVVDLDIASS